MTESPRPRVVEERAPPDRPSSFVGRDQVIVEVAYRLGSARLLSLTGPAGIGKTRLAAGLVDRLGSSFGDGAAMVELASTTEPLAAVASALRVRDEPGRRRADALVAHLSERRMLLVLDNCEHLVGATAALVETLLGACAGLTVLATSQEPLGVSGEVAWPVPPLSLPETDSGPEDVHVSEAVRLFCDRAASARPGFSLVPDVVPAVVEICRRLDGLPLAIELAAARVAVLSPAEIARRLDRRFELLAGAGAGAATGADGGPGVARHRSIQAALDWSHELCSGPERKILRRLSVFVGGFDLDAAEQVAADGALARSGVAAHLGQLVARSLVGVDTEGVKARYRLLETIRDYGRARLAEAGETTATGDAHARWARALAEEAEPALTGAEQQLWLERLEAERDNLRVALEWFIERGNTDGALRLAGALSMFWRLRGEFSEGRRWLEAALSGPGGEARARARALWGAGLMEVMLGAFDRAVDLAEAALGLARHSGDSRTAARALNVRGLALMYHEGPSAALASLEESTALAGDADDPWCLADSLARCGQARVFEGDAADARRHFQAAIELARARGDRATIGSCLMGLGWIAVEQDDAEGAERLFGQAASAFRELGPPFEMAEMLCFQGDLARSSGDFETAGDVLEQSLTLARNMESPILMARSLGALGRLAQAEGDNGRARHLAEEAVVVARGAGLPYILVRCLLTAARAAWAANDLPAAGAGFEEALAMGRASGHAGSQAMALVRLAELAQLEGHGDRAAALHYEALGVGDGGASPALVAVSLDALARAAVERGDHLSGVRLVAAARSLRERSRATASPEERSATEALLAAAHRALGAAGFGAAWAEGTALSLEEAVAYACRGRGPRPDRLATGWASLTRTEREVALRVGEGLTNAEIGQRLFVSNRTVENHLYRIFRKLDVGSRLELARLVASHRIASE